MFEGIEPDRIVQMSKQEQRWLDNIKKALYECDKSYLAGEIENRCLPELFKAIDTAKTLRRSLRGEGVDGRDNRKRFVEFIKAEIPGSDEGGLDVSLIDQRAGEEIKYSFAGLCYAIRCMVHENENLNANEEADYHILIDWSKRGGDTFTKYGKEKVVCDGYVLVERLREIISKFITVIEATVNATQGKAFSITCRPKIGSIKPIRKKREV